MVQTILMVVLIVAIIASTFYLGRRYEKLNDELLQKFSEIDTEFAGGLEKEAQNAIEGAEPTVIVSDLQRIIDYSPSKKERERRKYKEDGDR